MNLSYFRPEFFVLINYRKLKITREISFSTGQIPIFNFSIFDWLKSELGMQQ
jgi:hypothetical protein